MNIKEVTATTKEIAELFGVADQYISQLVLDHGMPKVAHNTFNLWECITWRFKYNKEIFEREKKEIREENTRSRKERVEAELKELELAAATGRVIDKDIWEHFTINQATIYAKSLDALQTKLPPLITGQTDQQAVYQILEKEIKNIKNQVAELPADIHANDVAFNLS